MVIPSETTSAQADVIFVIEGTAVNKIYLNDIKFSYVIPILEYFSEGSLDHYDWHCKGTDVNYGIVVYYASDCLPRPSSSSYGPYSNPQKLLNVFDSLELAGGRSESHANIAEGFSTALHCFDDLQDLREPNATPQKFCILIANSPPYLFPVMESTKFSGYNVEQLAGMFLELGIHLSIISPRKIPALYNLFEKAGGEFHLSNYAKEPYHLAMLKGFRWPQQPVLGPPAPQLVGTVNATLPVVDKVENNVSSSNSHFVTQKTKFVPKDPGIFLEPPTSTVTRIKQESIGVVKEEPFASIKQETVAMKQEPFASIKQEPVTIKQEPLANIKQEPGAMPPYQKSAAVSQHSVNLPYSGFPYQQSAFQQSPQWSSLSDSPSSMISTSRESTNTIDRALMSQLITTSSGPTPYAHNMNTGNSTVVSGQQAFLTHGMQYSDGNNAMQGPSNAKQFQSAAQGCGQVEQLYQEGVTQPSQQFVPQSVAQYKFQTPGQVMEQNISGNQSVNMEPFSRDRSIMWEGTLEWMDRMRTSNPNEKVLRTVFCQILTNPRHGELDLKTETWPQKLRTQLLPKHLLGDVGNEYLKNSKCVLFRMQECEELQSLKTVLSTNCVGCINIVTTYQRHVIVLLYTKGSFVGLIPNDQGIFLDHLRKVLHQQKTIKDFQKLVTEQVNTNTREPQGSGVETSGLLTLQEAVQLSASESVLGEAMRHEQQYGAPMYQKNVFVMGGCQVTQPCSSNMQQQQQQQQPQQQQQQQHIIPFSQAVSSAGLSNVQTYYTQSPVLTDVQPNVGRSQMQGTSSIAMPFQDAQQHDASRIQMQDTSAAGGQIIWHGVLEWVEKGKNTTDFHNAVQSVFCQVKVQTSQGQPSVRIDSWPQKLVMQLIPKTIIGKIGGSYLQNSKSLLFEPQPCEAVESLKRLMCTGYAGCVQITKPGEVSIMILLYTAEKNCFIGFLPNDQAVFLDQFRKTIQAVKQMQQSQHQQVAQMQMDSSRGQQPQMGQQNPGYPFQ